MCAGGGRADVCLFFVFLRSFLNDIRRIASRDYVPSDGDVVRARLRTLGVQEYKIKLNKGDILFSPT